MALNIAVYNVAHRRFPMRHLHSPIAILGLSGLPKGHLRHTYQVDQLLPPYRRKHQGDEATMLNFLLNEIIALNNF